MKRSFRVLLLSSVSIMVAALTAACGTEHINVPAGTTVHDGAVLFNQRCAGCHTLDFAGAHGSAPNIRTAQANSGPNFNQRCERPIARVLYAIENGGFSGAYMPQNIVVGQDAIAVAKFVATYAGRQAPPLVGIKPCDKLSLGTLPSGSGTTQVAAAQSSSSSSTSSSTTTGSSSSAQPKHGKQRQRSKKKKSAHA